MSVRLTYEELDVIVQGFQAGYTGCAEKLVEAYTGFIAMYVTLLKYGHIDITSNRMRNFVGLYMSRSIGNKLHQWVYQPSIKKAIYNRVYELNKLYNSFSNDDIYNEAVIVLLTLAGKYIRRDKPTFHLYVEKMFNVYFKRQIESLTKDPLVILDWLEYDDEKYASRDELIDDEVLNSKIDKDYALAKASLLAIEEDELDLNWINGITTTSTFEFLAPIDRHILVLRYVKGLNDSEIAEQLGYQARETVNRRRLKAEERIEQYVKDNEMFRLRKGVQLHNEEATPMSSVCREVQVQPEQDSELKIETRVYGTGLVG